MRRCSGPLLLEEDQDPEPDHISNLPDDLLVSVLRFVAGGGGEDEIKLAARTSLVARRWKDLWKYSPKNLRFTFQDPDDLYEFYYSTFKEFVDRVNRVLWELQLVDTVDDFNLNFPVLNTFLYGTDINAWIDFAVRRRVKRLTINLFGGLRPQVIIANQRRVDSLVSLYLHSVNATGEFLENLLSVCGSLEELSVLDSDALVNLTVTGPYLKLKYLEIQICWQLKRLHIHEVNLVSFKCDVMPHSIVVIHATPHLVNADIAYTEKTLEILSQLPHLQTLLLDFVYIEYLQYVPEFPKFLSLARVEPLVFDGVCSSALCARVLEASPSLANIKITFKFLEDSDKEKVVEALKHRPPRHHMRVVELVGFVGCQVDIGVALYIIENTRAVHKMIIDTNHPYSEMGIAADKQEAARKLARYHLEKMLPSGTELVVK